MNQLDVIRAWKDPRYRSHLSTEEQFLLPEHPAGSIELDEEEMKQIQGAGTLECLTAGCCSFQYGCTAGAICRAILFEIATV